MAKRTLEDIWEQELDAWLEPFAAHLGRASQRKWAPVYMKGLMGPGDRKSVQPMAERVAPGDLQQLHHFVSCSPWEERALWEELARRADALVGGSGAHLIIDDTAGVKQGKCSVGVARQYCGALGKRANCQALVSLTLARRETPVCVGLRLYLPKAWTDDPERCRRAGVPEGIAFKTKGEIALEEVDRLLAAGVRFDDALADACYGACAQFRQGLSRRGLRWAVGILPTQNVYPENVKVGLAPPRGKGRPRSRASPSRPPGSAQATIEGLGNKAFKTVTWRNGTKGPLSCEFAAVRVRPADGEPSAKGTGLPGEAAWLVCERRSATDLRYYLSCLPPDATLTRLAAQIKGRWPCEQSHQQMKEELGLDHFEGRSWRGLNHHLVLTAMSLAFLQHLRLKEHDAQETSSKPRRAPCRKRASRCAEKKKAHPRPPAAAIAARRAQENRPMPERRHPLPSLQPPD